MRLKNASEGTRSQEEFKAVYQKVQQCSEEEYEAVWKKIDADGDGNLTAEELAKLPTHQWSEGPIAADADEECCLCMEAFAGEDEVLLLPCGHYFHKPCIDRWFATKRYVAMASTAVVAQP